MIRRLPLVFAVAGFLVVAVIVEILMVGLPQTRSPTGGVPSRTPDDSAVGHGPSPTASRIPDPVAVVPSVSGVTIQPPLPSPIALPSIPEGAVPILYYHRVEAVPPEFRTWSRARQRQFLAYDTLPAALEAQLDWLSAHAYTTILPGDLAAHWDRGRRLPTKPVILSFDDGSPSWVATVLPMLHRRAMVAEFYLTLQAIAQGDLRWSDVRRLADAGNGIGAHDVHHFQLAGLPGGRAMSPAVMWKEIAPIRSIIRRHVGTTVDSMAYVGGGFDATLVGLVKRAGYTTARSILRGIDQSATHRFTLRVVRVGSHDDVIDPTTQTLVDGLPTFSARMHGVSDIAH